MKNQDQDIRELFQKKLQGHQVPVKADLWQAISGQITPVPSSAVSGSGIWAKTALWAKLTAAVAVMAIGLGVYKQLAEKRAQEEIPVQEAVVIQEQTIVAIDTLRSPEREELQKDPLREPEVIADKLKKEERSDVAVGSSAPSPVQALPAEKVEALQASQETTLTPGVNSAKPLLKARNNEADGVEITESVSVSADFDLIQKRDNPLEIILEAREMDGAIYHWEINGFPYSGRIVQMELGAEGRQQISLEVERASEKQKKTMSPEIWKPAKLIIPGNIFTPNGDGYNDSFDIEAASQNVELQELLIYDVTGKLVYKAEGAQSIWDGRLPDGEMAAEGNYLFSVRARGKNGESFTEGGSIYLKRK